MQFEESNSSQKEQLPPVLDELPLVEAMKSMSTVEVKPVEEQASNSTTNDAPESSTRAPPKKILVPKQMKKLLLKQIENIRISKGFREKVVLIIQG